MPDQKILSTLADLHKELEQTDSIDSELKSRLEQVDADIHGLLDSDKREAAHARSLMERLEEIGAEFAARHPHTESFFQELIGALGRLGI